MKNWDLTVSGDKFEQGVTCSKLFQISLWPRNGGHCGSRMAAGAPPASGELSCSCNTNTKNICKQETLVLRYKLFSYQVDDWETENLEEREESKECSSGKSLQKGRGTLELPEG